MRTVIMIKLEEEERKMCARDRDSIKHTLEMMDKLRRKTRGSSTEELRNWRESRY